MEEFPVSEFVKVKDGVTLYKSSRSWVALILTEDGRLRLYKWRNKNGTWKVDLARFNIDFYADKLIDAIGRLRGGEE